MSRMIFSEMAQIKSCASFCTSIFVTSAYVFWDAIKFCSQQNYQFVHVSLIHQRTRPNLMMWGHTTNFLFVPFHHCLPVMWPCETNWIPLPAPNTNMKSPGVVVGCHVTSGCAQFVTHSLTSLTCKRFHVTQSSTSAALHHHYTILLITHTYRYTQTKSTYIDGMKHTYHTVWEQCTPIRFIWIELWDIWSLETAKHWIGMSSFNPLFHRVCNVCTPQTE